jgi:hypothetical protein
MPEYSKAHASERAGLDRRAAHKLRKLDNLAPVEFLPHFLAIIGKMLRFRERPARVKSGDASGRPGSSARKKKFTGKLSSVDIFSDDQLSARRGRISGAAVAERRTRSGQALYRAHALCDRQ